MAIVDVNINGLNYKLSCDDGQENHLRNLATAINNHVKQLAKNIGAKGDNNNLLLVMTAIMVTDKLADAENEIRDLKKQINEILKTNEMEKSSSFEDAIVPILDGISGRIEKLLQKVE